jgi:tryptophanyl-tRNA synthetase
MLLLQKDYIAVGIDPLKTVLYKQSDIPETTELVWIFNCLITVPYLQRAHAYKDAKAKNKNLNVGTFDYPVLMAADILIMDADIVPVGKDQKQHLEITRDIADKFNLLYGKTFTLPEVKILKEVEIVKGTDGQKMSKSYGNTIPLFGSKDEIAKAVMGIVTDSSGKYPKNVYEIHKILKPKKEIDLLYKNNVGNYKVLKEALIEDLDSMISPMREKRSKITDEEVKTILEKGGRRARERSKSKIEEVRKKIGVFF